MITSYIRGVAQLALAASLAATAATSTAPAAEITFLCANALEASMHELLPRFERSSGHKVKLVLANIGTNTERVRKGEEADLAIVSPAQWETLHKEGKIAPHRIVIAKVGLGAFVKQGAPKPDIATVDAFKLAMLNARSLAVGDPARGSPVGSYVIPLFGRLGIADQVKPKLAVLPGRGAYEAVIKGEAELGFTQVSEILSLPGVDLVAPFPAAIQNYTTFVAAVPSHAREAAGAKALVDFLTSPNAAAALKAKGLEPG